MTLLCSFYKDHCGKSPFANNPKKTWLVDTDNDDNGTNNSRCLCSICYVPVVFGVLHVYCIFKTLKQGIIYVLSIQKTKTDHLKKQKMKQKIISKIEFKTKERKTGLGV
jgi:hypothetical protein